MLNKCLDCTHIHAERESERELHEQVHILKVLLVLQAGGEVTDYIIVLRTNSAIKTFSGNAHLSVGAGLSAAVGVVGRAAEADVRAGDGGYAACYTYSCSKGTRFVPSAFGHSTNVLI